MFVNKKVKDTAPWTYVMEDLKDDKITGTFHEQEMQKTYQSKFRIGKVIKTKCKKLYVKWKSIDDPLNSQIEQSTRLENMIQYYPKPYSSCKNIKDELLDLFNYAKKSDVKK